MPKRLFLVPMVGDGTRQNPYRGKYTRDPAVTTSGTLRYSRADNAIIFLDASQAYVDFVEAQSDAILLADPATIDEPITAQQAANAGALFEVQGLPAQFINAGDTRRQVIRGLVGMFLFSQRMEGRFGTGWKARATAAGVTLDTQFVDFPQALKDELTDVASSFGWNPQQLGLTNQSTLRQIMRVMSDQFESTPIFIGGQEI